CASWIGPGLEAAGGLERQVGVGQRGGQPPGRRVYHVGTAALQQRRDPLPGGDGLFGGGRVVDRGGVGPVAPPLVPPPGPPPAPAATPTSCLAASSGGRGSSPSVTAAGLRSVSSTIRLRCRAAVSAALPSAAASVSTSSGWSPAIAWATADSTAERGAPTTRA